MTKNPNKGNEMDDLFDHLEQYGIKWFADECYFDWVEKNLPEEVFRKVSKGFEDLDDPNLPRNIRRNFFNLIGMDRVCGPVHSMKAKQICRSGEFADSVIEKGDSVLDLGCHTGHLTTYYARRKNYISILGIDEAQDAISFAKGKAAELGIKNCSFEAIDFLSFEPLNHFDLVISTQSLYSITDLAKAAKVLRRITKDNGRIVAIEPLNSREKLNHFVSTLENHQLRLEHLSFVFYDDLGNYQGNPALVFRKNGPSKKYDLDTAFNLFHTHILSFRKILLDILKKSRG
jgi:ubiquinone/menaquinone biosynthesis C-methylase UbiE